MDALKSMDILSILFEPTVLIALVIAVFSNFFGRFGDLIVNLIKRFPLKIRTSYRIKKWNYSKKMLLLASNSNQVTYQIVKNFVYLIFFVSTIVIYLFLLGNGTLKGVSNLPMSVQHLIYCPIYIFEILWLFQSTYTQKLIKISARKRIIIAS